MYRSTPTLDLSIKKPVKEFLRQEFQNWYAQQICKQPEEEIDDMSMCIMKPFCAQWLVKMFEYILSHPEFIVNEIHAAGITKALSEKHLQPHECCNIITLHVCWNH